MEIIQESGFLLSIIFILNTDTSLAGTQYATTSLEIICFKLVVVKAAVAH